MTGVLSSLRIPPFARRIAIVLAVLIVALLGLEALRAALAEVHLSDVRRAIRALPAARIAAAVALTAISYLALTFYDTLALRTIGRRVAWHRAALASFTSYALSQNLGLSLLTGGSARYRVYSAAGLDLTDIGRVILLATLAFWGGMLSLSGVAMLLVPSPLTFMQSRISPFALHLAGAGILGLLGALLASRWHGMARARIGRCSLPLPGIRTMAAQLGVGTIDIAAAALALFVLVPSLGPDALPAFFLAYAVAIVIVLVTHVPGGIGVFEAMVLSLLPADRGTVFAALIIYRITYYFLPLLIAGLVVAGIEGHRLRKPIAAGFSAIDRAAQTLAPTLIALLAFGGGLILLVSGSLPGAHDRLHALAMVVPMPFIEASHFAASLAGTALLLTAPSLNARLQSGFHAARVLLLAGALFSLIKGFDYEEATILLICAGVLQYCKPAFDRRAGMLTALPDRAWVIATLIAAGLSLWAGFFAYKRIPYSDELWWQFALFGDAPRFLRASLGTGIVLVAALIANMLARPAIPQGMTELPDNVALAALATSPRSDAALAFTGDKSFVLASGGDAFLMYRVQGHSWIVMGDPVGPEAAWSEMVWAIRRACDAAKGRLCFYQASEAMLPLVVDLGFQAMKYGEEAHVDLTRFTLDGPRAKPLRHAIRRADANGLRFEIVPAAQVHGIIGALQCVSDAWLAAKGGREKRFSLGCFDPAYLSRFDCAVLWSGNRIVAFANIWSTADHAELSVDLMRHVPDAPYGTMDTLFVRLMQWGRAAGYGRFNLGLAPLSGIRSDRLAPLWARLGHALFSNGARLYHFAGLRTFKEKFAPEWTPRYIATSPGIGVPRALIDLAALVSI